MTDFALDRLLTIMARLRDPEHGCPWDVEQDFHSIAPYTVEEAYEVADAIARDDLDDLCDELGDLLFQVVFHARMAEEQGAFAFKDVATRVADKLVRRHPHVFADAQIDSAEAQTVNWERIKDAERAARGQANESALDGVARGLPPLKRAIKLQKRAARVGFDWPAVDPIFSKLSEEADELRAAIEARDAAHMEEELGDLLFVLTNLARKLELDPDQALAASNRKFEQRFRAMEAIAREQGLVLEELDLEAQEAIYQRVKQAS